MMKNSKLVTVMLDHHAETIRMSTSGDEDQARASIERMPVELSLWHAALADGWTVAELDAAFERRFGVKVTR